MNWNWGTVVIGLLSALGGGGVGLVAILKIWPDNRRTNADAALTLQDATSEGIDNLRRAARESVKDAEDRARRARAEAEYAQQLASAAHEDARQLRAELLQARTDMADLRAQIAAERASWALRDAEAQARIRGLEGDVQRALAVQWNGAGPAGHSQGPGGV